VDRASVVDQDVWVAPARIVATARGRSRDDRSATTTGNRSAPVAAVSVAARSRSDASRRPSRITRAPSRAIARAVASPRPEVGPVTTIVRPARAPGLGSVQPKRRDRMAGPIRLKLPTTEISMASSIAAVNM
jgi:hypothetical protein